MTPASHHGHSHHHHALDGDAGQTRPNPSYQEPSPAGKDPGSLTWPALRRVALVTPLLAFLWLLVLWAQSTPSP